MGYGTRPGSLGHTIRTFSPDNTDTTFYLNASWGWSGEDILGAAREHFKNYDLSFEQLSISAEHIHTDCLSYDLYDAGDYTTFLVISKVETQ